MRKGFLLRRGEDDAKRGSQDSQVLFETAAFDKVLEEIRNGKSTSKGQEDDSTEQAITDEPKSGAENLKRRRKPQFQKGSSGSGDEDAKEKAGSKARILGSDEEERITCSICFNFFKDPVRTDCSHLFCAACLEQVAKHAEMRDQQNQNEQSRRLVPNAVVTGFNSIRQATDSEIRDALEVIRGGSRAQDSSANDVQLPSPQTPQVRLFNCPICRKHISMANVKACEETNTLMTSLIVRCKNKGCKAFTLARDSRTHQETCPRVVVECNFAKIGCDWKSFRKDLTAHLSHDCAYDAIKGFFPKILGKYEHVHSMIHKLEAHAKSRDEILRNFHSRIEELMRFKLENPIDCGKLLMFLFSAPEELKKVQTRWIRFPFETFISILFVAPLLFGTFAVWTGMHHWSVCGKVPSDSDMNMTELWSKASNFTNLQSFSQRNNNGSFFPDSLGSVGNPMRFGFCNGSDTFESSPLCFPLPTVSMTLTFFALFEVLFWEGSTSQQELLLRIVNVRMNRNAVAAVLQVASSDDCRFGLVFDEWRCRASPIILGLLSTIVFSQSTLLHQGSMLGALVIPSTMTNVVLKHKFFSPTLFGACVGIVCAWADPLVLCGTFVARCFQETVQKCLHSETSRFQARLVTLNICFVCMPPTFFIGVLMAMTLEIFIVDVIALFREELRDGLTHAKQKIACHSIFVAGLASYSWLCWNALVLAIAFKIRTG